MSRISVIGAGAFGTALAISLARDARDVILWARDPGEMAKTRENTRRLPGAQFPPTLKVTGDLAKAAQSPILVLAIPFQQIAAFLNENREIFSNQSLVCASKGIDLATGQGPTELMREICPAITPAILSGPSFAVDIAAGLPTALTLAAEDPEPLQHALSTSNIRLYRSTDMTGVEIGGALKNVVAIACGVTIGAGLGESARAALMTRGYAEMSRFAQSRGAKPETLSGLSGFGDLTLSCTSEKSRNFSYGLAIGRHQAHHRIATIEGRATARAVLKAAEKARLEMPIAEIVVALEDGSVTVSQAVDTLLARPLKEE